MLSFLIGTFFVRISRYAQEAVWHGARMTHRMNAPTCVGKRKDERFVKNIFIRLRRLVTAQRNRAGRDLVLVCNRRGHPAADTPNRWVWEEMAIAPDAITGENADRRTPHDRWIRATFTVSDTRFGNSPLFFRYGGRTAAYIRAVKVWATVFPDQAIRWGRFSHEAAQVKDTCLLVTREEPFEKDGVTTYRLSPDAPCAHICVQAAPSTIPEYTSQITVEVEYRVDAPRGRFKGGSV